MKHTSTDERHSSDKRRDAHDWLTLTVLTLTLIAAGSAATFTGIQAWVARDQEHRALRAYVVAEPSLQGSFADPKGLRAVITSENMGQTPVYDLVVLVTTEVVQLSVPTLAWDMMQTDCKYTLSQEGSAHGATFRKGYSEAIGIPDQTPMSARLGLQQGAYALYAYGTICYRDIFQEVHHVRVCFYWMSDSGSPETCPYESISSD